MKVGRSLNYTLYCISNIKYLQCIVSLVLEKSQSPTSIVLGMVMVSSFNYISDSGPAVQNKTKKTAKISIKPNRLFV